MNNWRKFNVNAEEEKTETIQTEQSSVNISQFSCFVAIFPNWNGPGPSPKVVKKKHWSLTLPVLPGASEAWFELQLHITNPQIMEIFLVTFLILNQSVL
jgi:hypothetical protein